MPPASNIRKVAFLGDYLPRKCGIATFTTDLCRAMAAEFSAIQCLVVPVNDIAGGYEYPAEVRFEIEEQELTSYLRASDCQKMKLSGCWPGCLASSPAGTSALMFFFETVSSR